ncbi:MAG: LLM class flavin-dependent oxidoreductase, partial [Nitrososphaerales archaeon]
MKFVLGGMGNMFDELPHILEGATEADKHGFDTILIPDHYMWGRKDAQSSTLESWITLSFLAAKTENLRLGTLVTPIPFRPPAMLAKMISTLDHLSNGRVTLGVGAGWSQSEFEGYSEWSSNKTRVDKTQEGLELITRLWKDDVVNFDGKFYKAKGAELKPKPVQKPFPKLLFGTNSPRMLKLAGQYANICHLAFPRTTEEFQRAKQLLYEAADSH